MAHILNSDGSLSFKADTPKKTVPNTFRSDNIGVRDALGALGFDNESIGYNGKDVTYNNKYALTPSANNNGTAKTNTPGLIQGANNIYKNSGSDDYVVDVTAYAANKTLLPNSVKYHGNGSVTVGGIPIENVVVIDGNSYAPKSAIENAVNKYKNAAGHTSHSDIAKEYLKKTQSEADHYANQINNYGKFTYDPETDPAYIAYKNAYMKNAREAYENMYAQGSARTGGYANSAALSAAGGAYYNHMSELADRIPKLMDNAYTRYSDDFDMLLDALELYGSPQDRYGILSKAAEEDTKLLIDALEADYKRDTDNRDFNYKQETDIRDYNQKKYIDDSKLAIDQWEIDNILQPKADAAKLEKETQEWVAAQEKAYYDALFKELEAPESPEEEQYPVYQNGYHDNMTTEELLNWLGQF